jgi:hypothetical protein
MNAIKGSNDYWGDMVPSMSVRGGGIVKVSIIFPVLLFFLFSFVQGGVLKALRAATRDGGVLV